MKNIFFTSIIFLFFFSIAQSQTLRINEFQARNSTTLLDNYNEADDWIEIANVSAQSIDLNGYYITDDYTDKTKFKFSGIGSNLVIPSGGFIVIWADKDLSQGSNHVNFKLNGDNGQIALISPEQNIIDSVSYSMQYTDISQGRSTVNNAWKFYKSPTPGSQNSTTSYDGVSANPVFSIQSGIYTTNQEVTISASGSSVYYTLDNSSPTSSSTLYQGPISVNSSQVIRSIAIHPGWINSNIISQSYLFNINHTMPVINIITDSLNLYGPTGIYDNPGADGPEWEKFCQIKYLVDGKLKVESNSGLKIQGSSSVFMPKKSFRLIFKDEYGNSKIDYPFFGANNIASFKRLVLKAGYDDDITTKWGTLLRDAFSIALYKEIGGFPEQSKFATLYLNNQYWGIYDIRESIDEYFIEAHTNYTDFDLIRLINTNNDHYELKFGTSTNWNNLYSYVSNTDFSINDNYQQVQTLMDMDQFISLISFVQCSGYYSWCYGVSYYHDNLTPGKWSPIIWDTDRAYGNNDYDDSKNLTWNGFTETNIINDKDHYPNMFPHKFLANSEFKRQFVNRICDLYNSTFIPDSAIAVLDSVYSIVKPEIDKELARWNPTDSTWEDNVERIKDYLRERPAIVKGYMKSFFDLSDFHTLTLDVQGNGTLRVNTLHITQFPWNGDYVAGNPFELKAIADHGYHFAGWDVVETNPVSIKSVDLQSNTTYTAIFEIGPESIPANNAIALNLSAFPNPFSNNTNISFHLNKSLPVDISVYASDGRLVKQIIKGNLTEGDHSFTWNGDQKNGSSANAGLYFIQLKTSEGMEYLKIIKM